MSVSLTHRRINHDAIHRLLRRLRRARRRVARDEIVVVVDGKSVGQTLQVAPQRGYALADEEQHNQDCEEAKRPHAELGGEEILARRVAALARTLGKELTVSGNEVAVAVNDLAPVVHGAAETRAL